MIWVMIIFIITGCSYPAQTKKTRTDTLYFHVDDFGANPDGVTNSEAGIRAALLAAKASGKSSVIEFSKGVYRVSKDLASPRNADLDFSVIIDDMKDCILQGSGEQETTIMTADPSMGGIRINRSENITIRNIKFDYETTPFTQGTVVSADTGKGEIILDLDEGYPELDHSCFQSSVNDGTWGGPVEKNDDPKLSRFGAYALYTSGFDRIDGRRWKIKIAEISLWTMEQADIKPGSHYVQVASRYASAPVTAWNSSDICVTDVTIYAAPSVCVFLAMCDRVIIERYTVTIKPGTDRMISGNADGVHAASVRGGIRISNSYFHGMMDNGIDIHTRPGWINQKYSDRKIKINRGVNEYRVGDLLHIFDAQTNHLKGIATVTDASVASAYEFIVELDKDIADIHASTNLEESDRIYNASACGQDSVIENNTFFNHRGRSILMTSHDILIRNNQFNLTHNSDVALFMEISPEWGGGLGSYNITIKDNIFTGIGDPRINTAIAANTGDAKDGVHTRIIHGLLIEENRFENIYHQAIQLNGAENVVIRNNIINISASRIRGSAIVLKNARGILIDGLKGKDPNTSSLTTSLIFAENTVVAGDKGVRIRNIDYTFTQSQAMQPPILLSLAYAIDQRNRFIENYVQYSSDDEDPVQSESLQSIGSSSIISDSTLSSS
jgi:hypothetical protein